MNVYIKVLSIIYIRHRALGVFKFLPVSGESASGHPLEERTTVRSKPGMLLILGKEHYRREMLEELRTRVSQMCYVLFFYEMLCKLLMVLSLSFLL